MDKVSGNLSNVVDRLATERQSIKKIAPEKGGVVAGTEDGVSGEESVSMPDYVVSVTAEKLQEKSTYTPEEVKAKARAFLSMGTASPEEREVLSQILGEKE